MRDDIKPGEILELLKKKISDFDTSPEVAEVGKVIQAGDGIARAWGLERVLSGELVEIDIPGGEIVTGMVMNLEEESIGIILFAGCDKVEEGFTVRRTGRVAEVPVGENLLGRVVDPLGNPIDGRGEPSTNLKYKVEIKGPGITDRQDVNEPLQTGLKAIDAMIPIGKGQRELIIGDRRTGKTAIAIDTIINQQNSDPENRVHCFYVAIGQKRSSVVQLIENLRKHGAMEHTTVVAATASDPAAFQFLAPYSATAMAEYFRDNGRHALIIFDDLTKHAQAYREISLLMRRSPGREAYPGDIFYLHSRLLERAAKLSADKGGGSLTALPIVETQEGDISAYIPTNVISITDGQIFLEANLFNSGLRPAINVGVSVSRVGGDAQVEAMKKTSGSLRINLAQFREMAAFMQFSSDLDAATRKQLDRGERLTEILKQGQYAPLDVYKQVIIIKAALSGRLDKYATSKLKRFENELFRYIDEHEQNLLEKLRKKKNITEDLEADISRVFDDFEKQFEPDATSGDIDAGYTVNMAMAINRGHARFDRDMLHLIEGVTARELATPSLEDELQQIIDGKDLLEKDRFDQLVEECRIVDLSEKRDMENVFHDAADIISETYTHLDADVVYNKLIERENTSSTALSSFFAIPHLVIEGENMFDLVLMRSREGIRFSDTTPHVHAIFFLVGTIDQRHYHLVALSAIAQLVQSPAFENEWMAAKDVETLRNILRFGKRKREKKDN
ncbi:MAG: F0F1 ATP synthase subunit alpha [Kiritimatiellia bacterium]